MKLCVELVTGINRTPPTKRGMQKNIDALNKAIDRKPLSTHDVNMLMDTLSILKGLQEECL